MQIQRFHIRRFRSIENLDLIDLPALFVLFGRNGSGKSNILAALETIFSPKIAPAYQIGAPESPAPFYRGIVSDFSHNYYRNEPSECNFEILLKTTTDEVTALWPEGFSGDTPIVPAPTDPERVRIEIAGHFSPEPQLLPDAAETILESTAVNEVVVYDGGQLPEPWLPHLKDTLPLEERAASGEALLVSLTGLFSVIGAGRTLTREPFRILQPEARAPSESDQDLVAIETTRQRHPGPDRRGSFKRRLFGLGHSQLQLAQDKFRLVRKMFRDIGGWGEMDFAQAGPGGEDLEIMTWDEAGLWLPVGRRGTGAEQLLVMIAEILVRDAALIGIEELESNLDDENKDALFQSLERLVATTDVGLGQVIATAHSSYYASNLEPNAKRVVRMDGEGRTIVEPWSAERYAELFRPRLKAIRPRRR